MPHVPAPAAAGAPSLILLGRGPMGHLLAALVAWMSRVRARRAAGADGAPRVGAFASLDHLDERTLADIGVAPSVRAALAASAERRRLQREVTLHGLPAGGVDRYRL